MITWDQTPDYGPNDEGYSEEVECRHCGRGGLHWEETDEGFRLYDSRDRKHKCMGSTASVNDFDDVSKG